MSDSSKPFERYSKQVRFAPLGKEGQQRLCEARVLLCGCGALGSVIANTLARAGVGYLKIVDRDYLEISNLQRQVLFDEDDVAAGMPKAIAAANRLAKINSSVEVDPIVADVTYRNMVELAEGVDLVLDGTDNFETRLLLNDYSLKYEVPWVFGGVIGAEGQMMPILPGKTACLACLVPEPPAAGSTPTCDSAGVLGSAVNVVASLQATEAIKILSHNLSDVSQHLTVVDLWNGRYRTLDIKPDPNCQACGERNFVWLYGRRASETVILCDKGAVQISPPEGAGRLDLESVQAELSRQGVSDIKGNQFLLQFVYEGHEITLFADGRAIVGDTKEESQARAILARCLGA